MDYPEDNNHSGISVELILLTFLAAIGGFLFGYDTGVISSASLYLRDEFSLSTFQQEIVVSGTVGAAAIFSTTGGYFNRHFGRKRTILASSLLFIIGSFIMALAFSFWLIVVGRIIVGVAVGVSSSTVPTYLAETAPARFRGRMLASFQLMITFGMWMASLLSAGFSYLHSSVSWRWMLGFAGFPAFLQLVGFSFMPESPRWLVYNGREVDAFRALVKINRNKNCSSNNHRSSLWRDRQALCLASNELTNILKIKNEETNIRCSKKTRCHQSSLDSYFWRALLIGCLLQIFQQFCGINTVMYYSATIIQMGGILDNNVAIWVSSITSGVNFVATFMGMYLVDRVGRRPLLLSSIIGVTTTLILLSISFFVIEYKSIRSTILPNDIGDNYQGLADHCNNLSSCILCLYNNQCGFCSTRFQNKTYGQCMAISSNKSDFASYGLCSDISTTNISSKFSYYRNYCPSNFAWMPIVALALYLCSFAAGFGPMPWTICAEIFPNKSRSLGTSITTTMNWASNLLISLTFLSLAEAISRQGAFLLYAGLSALGFIIFYMFLPETTNLSIDDIEQLAVSKKSVHTSYSTFQ